MTYFNEALADGYLANSRRTGSFDLNDLMQTWRKTR